MTKPKFGRGDTIKILPDTPFNRAPGSIFIVRNVFQFSNLNATVRDAFKDIMIIGDETPVYYCSDEISYNCFVPESYIEKGLFFRAKRPIVEAADIQDKLFLRIAMIAEALRKSQSRGKAHGRKEDENYEDGN